MGSAGSISTVPYASVEDAKKAGKTQAEIDEWLKENHTRESSYTQQRTALRSELDAVLASLKKTKTNKANVEKQFQSASGWTKLELEEVLEEMEEEIREYERKNRILSEKLKANYEEENKHDHQRQYQRKQHNSSASTISFETLGSELDVIFASIKKIKAKKAKVEKELRTASKSAKITIAQTIEEMEEDIRECLRKKRTLFEKLDTAYEGEKRNRSPTPTPTMTPRKTVDNVVKITHVWENTPHDSSASMVSLEKIGLELDAVLALIEKTKTKKMGVEKELQTSSGSTEIRFEQDLEEMMEEIVECERKQNILSENFEAVFEKELKAIGES